MKIKQLVFGWNSMVRNSIWLKIKSEGMSNNSSVLALKIDFFIIIISFLAQIYPVCFQDAVRLLKVSQVVAEILIENNSCDFLVVKLPSNVVTLSRKYCLSDGNDVWCYFCLDEVQSWPNRPTKIIGIFQQGIFYPYTLKAGYLECLWSRRWTIG